MTSPNEAGHGPRSFDLRFVLETMVAAGYLTSDQAAQVRVKEPAARARVLKGRGEQRGDVSPVEIVAAFRVPLASGRGELDQDRITEAVAAAVGLRYQKIDPLELDMALITQSVSRPYAQAHAVLPLERTAGGELVVAIANPFDDEAIESVHRLTGLPVVPVLAAKKDILKSISEVYGFRKTLERAADDFSQGPLVANFEQLVSLSGNQDLDASDQPIIRAVDYLLRYAFDNRASDIHVEPKRDASVVRMRIDGVLHEVHRLPANLHAPVSSRLKMLSRMDISERRKPQDGRIKTEREGREVELRVSTLPTAFGEKVVVRVFDPEKLVQNLAELGFEPDELITFERWIRQPHGLLLVTGPTGSGKTTTLYSALKAVTGPTVNVTTIEDPIEMVWDAFNQVQVQPRIGLTFAQALRHILRQDPDVIMVGEIRDAETAENAIQAALTGHLVLSTLHTNDAIGAIGRMQDLDVPPFLLSSCLLGVMAQRLVRRVCDACLEPVELAPDLMGSLGVPLPLVEGGVRLMRGKGCVRCRGTGLYGRSAIFEIFDVDEELREAIAQGAGGDTLSAMARKNGLRSLREAAVRKLARGETTPEEVLRVTRV